jgi:hypothetical protein
MWRGTGFRACEAGDAPDHPTTRSGRAPSAVRFGRGSTSSRTAAKAAFLAYLRQILLNPL